MEQYTQALCRAIAGGPNLPEVDTIYFGGGTPILLGATRVERILAALHQRYTIANGAEITLEANPHATLLPVLMGLRQAGVNRLSMGLQSSNPTQLRTLGRLHSPQEVVQGVADARRAGFANISLDVMLGLPGQTQAELADTLDFCTQLEVEHISAYLLKIEEGTPFARQYPKGASGEEDQADQYLQMVKTLVARGYDQYEISNFARPGYTSRHNCKYWDLMPYLGIGPAAHSFVDGQRFYFPEDLEGFLAAEDAWSLAVEDGPGGSFEEYVMLRLRLAEGLVYADAHRRYPQENWEELRTRAKTLRGHGLLQEWEDRLALTPQGMLVSNSVIGRLILD